MSLTLKLTSLGIRTVAKPIGNLIKRQAREHEGFRRFCVRFAQGLHRIDARMRLGLLEDSEAITRQIEREAASAEARRLRSQHRPSSNIPTVKTQEEAAADEQAKAKERKFIEEKVKNDEKKRERQMLKPLSDSKAVETGANFASEAFVFIIGVGLVLFENWRSRRKESNRRDDLNDRLERLEDDVQRAHDEKTVLEDHVGSLLTEIHRLKATSPASNGNSAGSSASSGSSPEGSTESAGTNTSTQQKSQSKASQPTDKEPASSSKTS